MLFSLILDRFAKRAPISVMVHTALEYALDPEALDALLRDTAEQQHEKTLLFSSVVDLMSLVVARVQPSLDAAYQTMSDTLPVSIHRLAEELVKLARNVRLSALKRHKRGPKKPVRD